jgi:putative transposase
MVIGLRRHQDVGDLHFVAFSSYQRHAYLGLPAVKDLFEDALERIRGRYGLEVVGYVVMPEHVHLLVSEPCVDSLDVGLQALKLSVARRSERGQFWQARYYDLMFIHGISGWRSWITCTGIR